MGNTTQKVCPKCSYERTATDTAPEYECPNCGVVYEKFEQLQDPNNSSVEERVREYKAKQKEMLRNRNATQTRSQIRHRDDLLDDDEGDWIIKALYFIGGLGLLGGLLMCATSWPDADFPKQLRDVQGAIALAWFIAGIVECALFCAIAKGLEFVRGIRSLNSAILSAMYDRD